MTEATSTTYPDIVGAHCFSPSFEAVIADVINSASVVRWWRYTFLMLHHDGIILTARCMCLTQLLLCVISTTIILILI